MKQGLLGISSKLEGDAGAKAVSLGFRRSARALCLAALLVLARPPQISGQELRVDDFPTGARPLGVDLLAVDQYFGPPIVVVANSAEDSVSFFRVKLSTAPITGATQYALELLTIVRGISAPYAVASCRLGTGTVGDRVLVTSPSDNSVTVIRVPDGRVLGKTSVGPQPHAVACFRDPSGAYKGLVSNVGDDTLIVLDVTTLSVEARIPEVPASRGLHGISIGGDAWYWGDYWFLGQAWVAGTNADSVTLVSLSSYRVLS